MTGQDVTMFCNATAGWIPTIFSHINGMDHQNIDIIASALFGDSTVVLNAVASLLTRHQNHKENNTSQLELTNKTGKDSVLANVILGTISKSNVSKTEASHTTENLIPSFEQVHALATANLVASTQRDIAKRLAEATDDTVQNNNKDHSQEQKEVSKKGRSENLKKTDKRKLSSKAGAEPSSTSITDPKWSSEPKALVCSYEGCNRKFAWLNHLKYHELTHTNNRQFRCPEDSCGKTFFTAQSLSVHQRTHTGEKPFKCHHPGCTKTFTTAGNLKNHQRIHTGEQPFVCDHLNCNRRFTEQSSLRKHKLTHSGDKPFECKICGKKFTQSGSRRQHLIRHHLDDEIRQSFKQEDTEKDVEEDESMDEERKQVCSSNTNRGHTLPTESNAVSCSPQVLVLNNAYPGLSTSESFVLSHGLSDHVVTVKTQVMDHAVSDSQSISLSHTLSSDVLHDAVLHAKPDDFVVLSEAPIYDHNENPGDIVYAAGILDQEEVTHASYISSHVDYSGEMTHSDYSSHRELTNTDDFTHPELSHSEHYITHGSDITVAEYVAADCVQHLAAYNDSKTLSHSYLDSDKDVAHIEFIGAEEVAVAQCRTEGDIVECVTSDANQAGRLLTDSMTSHFQGSEKLSSNFSLGEATFMDAASCHPDLSYVPSSLMSHCDHSVVVVKVMDNSSHTVGAGPAAREIHMDPMMECDEEPDKHQFLTVS